MIPQYTGVPVSHSDWEAAGRNPGFSHLPAEWPEALTSLSLFLHPQNGIYNTHGSRDCCRAEVLKVHAKAILNVYAWHPLSRLSRIYSEQGFSTSALLPSELDNSLLWGALCVVGCLAASLASPLNWWQSKTSPEKQPRCPSSGEWINKLWCIQTMGYYSVMKRNERSSQKKTRRNLKGILLSERSQSKKVTNRAIPTTDTWHSEKGKIMQIVKRSVVAKDSGRGREGWVGGAHGIFRAVKLFSVIQ